MGALGGEVSCKGSPSCDSSCLPEPWLWASARHGLAADSRASCLSPCHQQSPTMDKGVTSIAIVLHCEQPPPVVLRPALQSYILLQQGRWTCSAHVVESLIMDCSSGLMGLSDSPLVACKSLPLSCTWTRACRSQRCGIKSSPPGCVPPAVVSPQDAICLGGYCHQNVTHFPSEICLSWFLRLGKNRSRDLF